MKKIIFGITSLTLGGAERVLIDVANELCNNYDITIFTIYGNGDLEQELNSKIKIKSLYDKRYSELSTFQKKILPIKIMLNNRKIYKKNIEGDYIAQISFLEGAITRLFSIKNKVNKNCKKISWIHNDISKVFGKSIKAKIKIKYDRKIYKRYDKLVFVSNDNLKAFEKKYPEIKENEKEVIYNYIDAKRILNLAKKDKEYGNRFNKNETNLVQVSRLVEQKAIERLIDVHKKLIDNEYKHNIFVIGEGPLKEKLEEKIKKEKVQKTFILLGAKKNPYPYMKNATANILFSNYEGYPMVIEEAKTLNKFIAITDTAARETLTNYEKNSIIVQNDKEGIEKAIKYIIDKKDKLSCNTEKNNIYDNKFIINKIIKLIGE